MSEVVGLIKQIIASCLSVILLVNMSVPALAQTTPSAERAKVAALEKAFENEYRKTIQQTFVSESTNVMTPAMQQKMKVTEEYLSDPVIQQLMDLRSAFFPLDLSEIINPEKEQKDEKAEFLAQYYAEVEEQARLARQQLKEMEQKQRIYINQELSQAQEAGVSERVAQNWLQVENEKIQQVLNLGESKIKAWQTQAIKEADEQYQQMLKLSAEQNHRILASKIRELMNLYQKYPMKVYPFLMDIAYTVFLMDGSNTTLFTDAEKKQLHHLFLQELQNGKECEKTTEGCGRVLTAVSALGILGNSTSDANAISEFIEAHFQTPYAASALLAGVGSLLAMKRYSSIRGLVAGAVNKELSASPDLISFTGLVKGLTTFHGQYLGEVSKWAQFPVPSDKEVKALSNSPSGNAWEEVAYMLAEEGSPAALEILQTYGINTCFLEPKKKLEEGSDIMCATLQPFLVGALLSGKSGTFSGSVNRVLQEGAVIGQNGGHYVTAYEASQNRQAQEKLVRNMNAFASSIGLTLPVAIAHNMYQRRWGDLDADSQWLLDNKLFTFVNNKTDGQKALSESLRLQPYTRTSDLYKAKQRSYNRAKVWITVGTLADIAFLVWCAYDLVRLSVKAVNFGRAIYMTTKAARNGVSAATRTSILWKMKAARALVKVNRRFPARIKKGMAGSVRAVLPQFAKAEPLLKVPGGITQPSFMEVALQGAKFSAETGSFALESRNISSALAGQAKLPQSMSELQKSLNLAADRANVTYASRPNWMSRLVNEDLLYRFSLSKELKKQGMGIYNAQNRSRMLDFAQAVRKDASIRVPQKAQEMKKVPLIDKNGNVDPTMLRRIAGPLLAGTTSESRLEIKQALDMAQERAGMLYANRGAGRRFFNTLFGKNKSVYNDMLANSLVSLRERDNVMTSFSTAQKDQVLSLLGTAIRENKNISIPQNVNRYAAMDMSTFKEPYKTLNSALFTPNQADKLLPVEFHVDYGVKGVKAHQYQRVMFVKKNGSYFMGMSDGIGKPVDLSRFKIQVPTADMPALMRAAMDSKLAKPLELKLNVYKDSGAFKKAALLSGESKQEGVRLPWKRPSNLVTNFRTQNEIFSHEVPVYLRAANGSEVTVPIKVLADTRLKLQGSRFVLGADNKLHLYKGNDLISNKLFYFSLPKREIGNFVEIASNYRLSDPLRLSVTQGRNKIMPLYISTGLSLSSASVGLIAPLETIYKDRITDIDKTLISLAFPYLPSLAAPALSPVVMRFGALRVVQAALASVALGLGFTWFMGFSGHLNKDHLPPIWPLFVSGAAIGISSALSRSGLNILIDTMGGGQSLLKSMAFKNIGSVALLLPAWLVTSFGLRIWPTVAHKELPAETLAKPTTDFSFAFPVLTGLTTFVLLYLSASRVSPLIGRATRPMKFWPEMGRSLKTMVAPEVWPLATATFFFTGFEAAAFSKASSQSFRPFYEKSAIVESHVPGNRGNAVAMFTGLTVAALPLTARLAAPKLLKTFSSPLNPSTEYKRMLLTSYLFNAAGGTLLMQYGMDSNPKTWEMLAGITLMGLGTANVTQSLQKLANIKIGSGATLAKAVKGLPAAEAAAHATELKNITMTGFSWSQLGLAAIPLLQSSYVDREVTQGVSDGKGPLSSIWIPLSSLAISSGLILYGTGMRLPFKEMLRTGALVKLGVNGVAGYSPMQYLSVLQQQRDQKWYNQMDFRVKRYQQHQEEIKEAAARKKDLSEENTQQAAPEEEEAPLSALPMPSLSVAGPQIPSTLQPVSALAN